ncbi:MAG: hypothetical protein ACJ76J_07640 [Thermoanaerobaculia bacterium]
MADINYFLEPKGWKVTAGSGVMAQHLPGRGSSIKFEPQQNGSARTFRIVPAGRSRSARTIEGFRYQNGRLELPTRIAESDCLLVIEEDKKGGKNRLKGKVESPGKPKPKAGPKPLPEKDMTSTWGAESNAGTGGTGGGTK